MNFKKFNLKKLKLNKTKTLILVGVITLLLFVGGATYAYFAFSTSGSTSGNMEIISGTVDNLLFNIEKDIYINATLENFGEGQPDLHDDTDATATLIPNNTTSSATAMYNIYIIIEANDLEYTTTEHTPELLLNVTDPNGNPVENITGLVHYDNGFDITTRTGGFLIASDYVINAQDIATIQTWNVEITLMNLDSNQNDNMRKTFSAKLYLTQDKMSSYNPVQVTNMELSPTYNSVDTTLNLSNGSADVAKYYFGIEEANTTTGFINNNSGIVRLNNTLSSADTVTYHESDTPNYKFTNLKENTEYIIYSYVEDVNGIKSNVYETRALTNQYRIPTVGDVSYETTLNSITVTVNASSGDGTISKYMYSKDNGETWEESSSNTYTFDNLNDTTEYKIKIKVVDSNGRESTEYYKAISTDTYILPVVASVDATTTYNSITLTPTGTDGTGTIDHFEYSINGGEYQTSNVFSGLNEQTEYTINVKAIDNNGRETNPPYEIKITTDAYQVPIISNVTTSSTTDSITINVTASNGDGTITKYMYSRDNGSNWYESTSTSYTFTGLTSNTTFYVQVKAVDNNGRESAVSNATIKTQYINPVVNSVSASNVTSNSVTLTVSATAGSNNVTTYYYSSNNGSSYVSSSSNSYTFTGLNPLTTYNFRVKVGDSGGVQSGESTTSATTLEPTLADVCSNGNNLASCIISLYNTYGEGTVDLYYHNGSGSYTNANLEAGDNSYRYSGGNNQVNNYVCFGSDASTCPKDNLYQIIGVFNNKVKLIKSSIYISEGNDGMAWSCDDFGYPACATSYPEVNNEMISYNWSQSQLNVAVLNGVYLNELGSTWSNKISSSTWYYGGGTADNIIKTNAKTTYNYEVGPNKTNSYTSKKVGLIYVSDVAYSAETRCWNSGVYNYGLFNENCDSWLISDVISEEWTITPITGITGHQIYQVQHSISGGHIPVMNGSVITNKYHIRPTFYLNSNITYNRGTGTQSDPIRIN